jgi:hypothetical protein
MMRTVLAGLTADMRKLRGLRSKLLGRNEETNSGFVRRYPGFSSGIRNATD